MGLISRHKILSVICFLAFAIVVILFYIFCSVFVGGSNVYGNRLDGIEKVELSSGDLKKVKESITASEFVDDAKVRVQGKIVYIDIIYKKEISVDSAKEIASKSLEEFSKEELEFYDFEYILTTTDSDNDDSGFKITGTKGPKTDGISFIKSQVIVMQNKKNNRIIMGSVIAVIVILFGVYFFLNYTKNDNSLSVIEKKWITDRTNTIVDVNVYNDVPIYGYNGSGISLDFLDSFTEKYNVKFNKIPYYSNDVDEYRDISFRILDDGEKLGSNDILFYKDEFVAVSLESDSLISISELDNCGILSSYEDLVSDYFGDSFEYKKYALVDEAVDDLEKQEIDYLILPNVMYMREILNNDLSIVLHISDLSYKYVLNASDEVAYSVFKKYYREYLESNYKEDYSKAFLDSYFVSTKTSDLETKNYNAKIYKYGYVVNMPYENYTTSNFVGTLSNYLKGFESVADVSFEVVKFDSVDELKSALVSGDIDMALTNFDYDSINMDNVVTSPFRDEEYVVLSGDNLQINSIKGLRNYEVLVVGGSNLHYLCLSNDVKTKIFSSSDDLIRNVDVDDVVLMDRDTYFYYKNNKLASYQVVYEGKIDDAYRFIIGSSNKTFASLFDYYVSSIGYDKIRFSYNTDVMLEDNSSNLILVVVIIGVIVGGIIVLYLFNKRSDKGGSLGKDERLKYIDPMTSLKNRNYLNFNIYTWDDNVIFPQSVIVFDINFLSEINDRYGREVGDEVVKKVASILINNQLENTDIIRSGGDEFLIYMIGYEEKDVVEFAKKMMRKMKDIPNSRGVEMGYSMILDEVKTVDDAINESIVMMKKNKNKIRNNQLGDSYGEGKEKS